MTPATVMIRAAKTNTLEVNAMNFEQSGFALLQPRLAQASEDNTTQEAALVSRL
jgi:hypothetical protein